MATAPTKGATAGTGVEDREEGVRNSPLRNFQIDPFLNFFLR